MSNLPPLGIQTYCFREFRPIDQLVAMTKEVGLVSIELWPGHASQDHSDGLELIRQIQEGGLTIASYGVIMFERDREWNSKVFEFARAMGARTISCDFAPDVKTEVVAQARDEGLRLAMHNHGREHHYGTLDQLEAMLEGTDETLGVCLDTAWTLDAGDDPLEALDRFGERVYGVHAKDFVFDSEGNPEDVIVGTGGLRLPEFMRRLDEIGVVEWIAVEYEGDADDPVPALKRCVDEVQTALQGL